MGNVRKVFVVDSDAQYSQKIEDRVSQMPDVEVYTFKSVEEASKYIDSRPDAILVDLYMDSEENDVYNGADMLNIVKSQNPEIDVIILTPDYTVSGAIALVEQRAFDCIAKTNENVARIESMLHIIFRHKELEENGQRYRNSLYFMSASCMTILFGMSGYLMV